MPITINTEAIVQRIPLNLDKETDPEQDSWVEVYQANQLEEEQRGDLFSEATRTVSDDDSKIEIKQEWNYKTQQRLEVYLTLGGCNLLEALPSGGTKPLFNFKKENGRYRIVGGEDAFKLKFGSLPASIASAIHKAVLTVNPGWDPKNRITSK